MLLQTKNLTKTFERRGTRFSAVADVTLDVAQEAFLCITGQSGSGKSTLLNLIAGMIRADSGDICFDGEDAGRLDADGWANLRGSRIGYIPQGGSLLQNLSVLDNVCLPWQLTHRTRIRDKAMDLLEKTGVAHLAGENPRNLSGGEARRVAFARSLIADPRLLIADEPTGELDPKTADEILQLFSTTHRQGVAVIVVMHDRVFPACATRHLVMEAGRLLK
jgi:putative ABC transport system ATP-binding protein